MLFIASFTIYLFASIQTTSLSSQPVVIAQSSVDTFLLSKNLTNYEIAEQNIIEAEKLIQSKQWREAYTTIENAIRYLELVQVQDPMYQRSQELIVVLRGVLKDLAEMLTQPSQLSVLPQTTPAPQRSSQYDSGIRSAQKAVEEGKVKNWAAARSWWEAAIKHMRAVPVGDPRYSQAQQKIQEYSVNYNEIDKRIRLEAQAQQERQRQQQQQRIPTTTIRSGGPARAPRRGVCECPYDFDSAGRRCGARSTYSKSGRGNC